MELLPLLRSHVPIQIPDDVVAILISLLTDSNWVPCRFRQRIENDIPVALKCYSAATSAGKLEALHEGSMSEFWCERCFARHFKPLAKMDFEGVLTSYSDEVGCAKTKLAKTLLVHFQVAPIKIKKRVFYNRARAIAAFPRAVVMIRNHIAEAARSPKRSRARRERTGKEIKRSAKRCRV